MNSKVLSVVGERNKRNDRFRRRAPFLKAQFENFIVKEFGYLHSVDCRELIYLSSGIYFEPTVLSKSLSCIALEDEDRLTLENFQLLVQYLEPFEITEAELYTQKFCKSLNTYSNYKPLDSEKSLFKRKCKEKGEDPFHTLKTKIDEAINSTGDHTKWCRNTNIGDDQYGMVSQEKEIKESLWRKYLPTYHETKITSYNAKKVNTAVGLTHAEDSEIINLERQRDLTKQMITRAVRGYQRKLQSEVLYAKARRLQTNLSTKMEKLEDDICNAQIKLVKAKNKFAEAEHQLNVALKISFQKGDSDDVETAISQCKLLVLQSYTDEAEKEKRRATKEAKDLEDQLCAVQVKISMRYNELKKHERKAKYFHALARSKVEQLKELVC
eukprot:g5471.t1